VLHRREVGQGSVREADRTVSWRGLGTAKWEGAQIRRVETRRGSGSVRVNRGTVIPVTGTTPRVDGRCGRDGTATYHCKITRLLLNVRMFCLWAGILCGFACLVSSAQLVKAQRARTKMGAFIETALVADNFARIEGRATP